MEMDQNQQRNDSVFSSKMRAGKRRTYFFDIKKTKGEDFYITITESTKKYEGDGYERHKLFIYKEDFNRFINSLTDLVDKVKTEFMPDYDYDEFTRRQEEWESAQENNQTINVSSHNGHLEEESENISW
jgi:hypothetical protein